MTTGAAAGHSSPAGSPRATAERQDLFDFVAYFAWPLLLVASAVLAPVRDRLGEPVRRLPQIGSALIMPVTLLARAFRSRMWTLSAGLLLLLPLIVCALLRPALSVMPGLVPTRSVLEAPSIAHIFGTDGYGRDLFWLVVSGAGTTYQVALCAAITGLFIGVPLGLATLHETAGRIVMMAVELIEALPVLVWTLMLMTVYGFWTDAFDPDSLGRHLLVFLRVPVAGTIIGICFAPRVVRLLRDQIKFFEREDFVALARAHGVSTGRILWFHVLWKNALPDLLLVGAALPGLAILTQINLDYFFSISSFRAGAAQYESWTQLLLTGEARRALIFFEGWWTVVIPSFFVASTTIGCLLWGDGLRNLRSLVDGETEMPEAYSGDAIEETVAITNAALPMQLLASAAEAAPGRTVESTSCPPDGAESR